MKNKLKELLKRDYLKSKKGFVVGMGSISDIWGSCYYANPKLRPEKDFDEIYSDWIFVGEDIENALKEFKKNINLENKRLNNNSHAREKSECT